MVCKRFIEPDGKPAVRQAIRHAVGIHVEEEDPPLIRLTDFPTLRRIRTRLNFIRETFRLLDELADSLSRSLALLVNRPDMRLNYFTRSEY